MGAIVGRVVEVRIGNVSFIPAAFAGTFARLAERLHSASRRSGMAVVSVKFDPGFEERFKRLVAGIEATARSKKPDAARGLPNYTDARLGPPALPRAPRREAREPAQLERAAARRTDREPGRRRARSRDYARTGRCSRRPAP